MTCTTVIPSISSTIKKLLLEYNLHSSYNHTKYTGEDDIIHNIFGTNFELLLNCINHPALVQKWKLNLDARSDGKKKMLT